MAAEVVLTFAAEGILKKVLSLAQKEFKFAWGFKAELEKLKESFTKIELLLNNVADKPQDPPIEAWVKKLKDIAHDAEDVLDELEYEGYRRKVEIQNHMKKKVLNFFSLSNPLAFRLQMAPKFQKINASLVDLKSEASLLGLVSKNKDATSQGIRWGRQTDAFFGKDEIPVGRKADVSKIVTTLTDSKYNKENLAVMAIVGMGGLGKTTLAKSIYNEDSIDKFFEKKIWISPSKDNRNAVLTNLQKELKDKRYLLVLDDVWNEDKEKWEHLVDCLSKLNSSGGSKIIVTTRSGNVASIAEKLLPRHELGKLSVDECWSVMKDRAFPNSSAHIAPEFQKIGREIAENCGGVPLVAKILGGILHTKKSIEEWSLFKNSRIWNNLPKGEDGIMPVLKLSFDNLESPSLKQCFAYCSMFKKDFEIQRDHLIQLWMAQGLLHPSFGESKDMEEIGNEYFDILLQSSLFQDATMDYQGIISTCKMHDRVHDMAELVSKSESLLGDLCGRDNTLEIRHVARVSTSTLENIPARSVGKFRSLFSDDGKVPTNILPQFKALRVLNLSYAIIEEFPISVGRLKHLRYLDISNTSFRALPKSIGKLYNLQTLRATNCALKEFPKELQNLINLRHIYFDEDIKFPKGISRLNCLRTLPYFSVGNEIGHQIEELAGLKQLKGQLIVCNLEHVKNGEEAKKAKLEDKTKVCHLEFIWTADRLTTDNNEEEDVLEGLRPYPELKSLSIENFMGIRFPSWMMSGSLPLNNLKKIQLLGCRKCEVVPPLGHLPNLTELEIRGMTNLKCIGAEFYSYGLVHNVATTSKETITLFPTLKVLHIFACDDLIEWKEAPLSNLPNRPDTLPLLEELTIERCPSLELIPITQSMASLRELEIECISLQSTSDLRTMTSLRRLEIRGCERLESWVSSLQFPLSLETLSIRGMPNLHILPSLDHLHSLRTLSIANWRNLKYLPTGLQWPTGLETLMIGGFWEELDSFPDFEVGSLMHLTRLVLYGWPKLKSLPQQIQHLTSLTELWISSFEGVETLPKWLGSLTSLTSMGIEGCKNLKNLPSVQAMQRLTKLEFLRIYGCHPLLEERCRRNSGTDWPKISHIPQIISKFFKLLKSNILRVVYIIC
ncbi:disease resistance protein RGA4 [Pyrus ussuriensis x Pyrus communis]|uniref:Disease resistance protein RGA4 n=1 Tax=Pyrus ussuriensis x Pyrus communis TaxID=2448454 RepID=A0A5N5G9E1_9ROSA|nr:disease resistance protein RGA4 [Pyrus ussuriensis x Pyrus communis]